MNDARYQERERLAGLYSDREPPPEMEEIAVAAWRVGVGEEEAVEAWRSRVGAGSLSRQLFRFAAGLVLFGAGWGTARLTSSPTAVPGPEETPVSAEAATGPAFMFLLWEGPAFEPTSPDGGSEEYSAWARSVAESGVPLSGDELSHDRVMVAAPGAEPGPADEAVVSGYFIVEARDAQQALELARGHPHLGHRGWLEVVPIVRR